MRSVFKLSTCYTQVYPQAAPISVELSLLVSYNCLSYLSLLDRHLATDNRFPSFRKVKPHSLKWGVALSVYNYRRAKGECQVSSSLQSIINTKTLKNTSVSAVKNTNNTKTLMQVQTIANTLCDRLSNETRFEYYCKIAWRLPESKIWGNLEKALTGNNPAKYFSFLCNLDLQLYK